MLGTKIPELMKFPADITMKVFGKDQATLEKSVKQVYAEKNISFKKLRANKSSSGKHVCVSIDFNCANPEQMEYLYTALAKAEGVLMVI